jgi:hypothetical protein
MKYLDFLISLFKKKIGPLVKEEHTSYQGNDRVIVLDFHYHNKIMVKIILMEIKPNRWVIHHECSRENPFLLIKVMRMCARIERIAESRHTSVNLSDDLKDVQEQSFLTTSIKCAIQNLLNCFTLFGGAKRKPIKLKLKENLNVQMNEF